MPTAGWNNSDKQAPRRPASLAVPGFRFSSSPSMVYLQAFAEALNENAHLPYKVSHRQIAAAPYCLVATTSAGEFVGACTIRQRHGVMAEIGFMLVKKEYRRQGLAQHMTRLRIAQAQQLGIKLLYARVRGNNIGSIENLRKAGFQSAGEFLSQKDRHSTISWFYLALQPMSEQACRRLLALRVARLIPVIARG